MPVADVNGVKLNYEVVGQGNAVFCLHGYSGSLQDWGNQIAVLSPAHKVIAGDERGHGKSAAPDREEDYSIEIFADDVFGLLNVLGIEQCCLAGHSLGGAVALQFALDHQEMLSGLVLVDTSSKFPMPPDMIELRQKMNEIARSQGIEAAFEFELASNPQRREFFQQYPDEREKALQGMLSMSVDSFIYTWKSIERQKPLDHRLSEISVPTIIFLGEEDIGLADEIRLLHKGIANSELVTVKGAGHSPHYEAPDVFNEALLNFLDRINW
jgi:3-oxoadipate enol-lactonase